MLPALVCLEKDKELLATFHFLKIHTALDLGDSFWKMMDASGRVLHAAKSHILEAFPGQAHSLRMRHAQLARAAATCPLTRLYGGGPESLMWLLWKPSLGNSLVLASAQDGGEGDLN